MILTQVDRDKFLKIISLLASGHAGERDAAALAAMRFLRQRKLMWCDVITADAPVVLPVRRAPIDWRRTVEYCLRYPGSLRPWEAGFLRDLRSFPRLSQKQRASLTEIAERLGVLEAAA